MNIDKIREAQFIVNKKNRMVTFWTCPFYFVRRNLYENILFYAPKLKGTILDFGCGAKPYISLFCNCTEYIGLDIEQSGHAHEGENVDIYYDGKKIPFEDCHFDNIFSSEVFEHVSNLDEMLDELYRVLKTDGLMLITAPFVWCEHEVPYDFRRYTSFGIKTKVEKHGFEIIDFRKSTSFIEMIYQMKAEYYRARFSGIKNLKIKHMLQRTIISFQTLKGMAMSKMLPVDWSFYGDNIVLCRKK